MSRRLADTTLLLIPERPSTRSFEAETLIKKREKLAAAFQEYQAALSTFIKKRLGRTYARRSDIDDLLQDVKVKALERLSAYVAKGIDTERWLIGHANDKLVDHLRYHRADRRNPDREEYATDGTGSNPILELIGAEPTPCDEVLKREKVDQVHRALKELSDEDREILQLRRIDGLTNKEAASRLGITQPKALKRSQDAMKRFESICRKHSLDSEND